MAQVSEMVGRTTCRELGVSDTTVRDALKQRTWKEN